MINKTAVRIFYDNYSEPRYVIGAYNGSCYMQYSNSLTLFIADKNLVNFRFQPKGVSSYRFFYVEMFFMEGLDWGRQLKLAKLLNE